MSQSKRHSAIETATNTAVGFVGSYFITLACLHAPGNLATQTLYATLGCTAWSLLRGYFLRRWFNHLHVKRSVAEVQQYGLDLNMEALKRGIYPCDCGVTEGYCTSCPNNIENRLCPHGEEADIGCVECREEYLEMRRDDQRNYEARG